MKTLLAVLLLCSVACIDRTSDARIEDLEVETVQLKKDVAALEEGLVKAKGSIEVLLDFATETTEGLDLIVKILERYAVLLGVDGGDKAEVDIKPSKMESELM